MKKLLTFALCVAAIASASAQKQNVDAAKKMSGKLDQLENARGLLQQAQQNPETANEANTWFISGKIEYDAFDETNKRRAVNENDPVVNFDNMTSELINGYNNFMKAIPLAAQPDAKGKINKKLTNDILNNIFKHHNAYYEFGANAFNNRDYDKAYDAFVIYGDIASLPGYPEWAKKQEQLLGAPVMVPDSAVATSYFNAGVAAYSNNKLLEAASAFKKARATNAATQNVYIYEIACWQNLAQRDSTMEVPAQDAILEIAEDGYKHFGVSQMLFLNNYVNTLITKGENQKALEVLADAEATYNDVAALYGLLGFVYDRMGEPQKSLDYYAKAVALPDVDYETLKNASRKYALVGTETWSAVSNPTPQIREEVKTKYFSPAMEYAQRAQAMATDSDPSLDYLIENIQYALDTYFK